MKRANGSGTIVKLSGNRRRPYACRKTIGFTEKGYPIYKYISYHATHREAERALNEYNNAPYTVSRFTVKDVYEKWLKSDPNKKEATLKNYVKTFRYLKDIEGERMSSLTVPMLQGFFDTHDFSKATLHHLRVLLNQLIDYSVKRDILPRNARDMMKDVDCIPRKATKNIERKVFSPEEIKLLFANSNDVMCRTILVYIYTGLRFEELRKLTEDCCHDNYVEIKDAKTPAGNRIVPLSDKVLCLLPIPRVQCYNTFRRDFDAVCENVLHIKHTPHDTRHTFISMLTEKEVDSRIIKKIVGHASDNVTEDVYTHISLEKMLDAVNRI